MEMNWILPGTVLEVDQSRPEAADELFSSLFVTGGLVLSQVCQITGLEPYTVQNWVKRGFLTPPVKKKYNRRQLSEPMQEVCYHFELKGVIYNLTVTLNGEWPTVPSITPLFANADWHEREMMELYGIQVTDHPDPRRLFLDEELDAGILNEAVPLSIMMNGACTTDLWERILKDKEKRP
jgi:NADH:ubiquinone oxidoreductase subunit C